MQSPQNIGLGNAPENIFLIGLMGAGKTSVGRLLAKRYAKTFYDSDFEIEHRTGVKISVIFDIEGESGFKDREAGMLRELVQLKNIVLATGGGAILREDNRRELRSHGTVIYLRATLDELWQRTRHDRSRPLLQTTDPRATLAKLFAERDPLYSETAELVLDTGNQSLKTLIQKLDQRLNEHVRAASPSETDTAESCQK